MAPKQRGRQQRARAEAVALPRGAARKPAARTGTRFAPSARSLLVGFGLVAVAVGAYAVARETSAFAVRSIEVQGAPPIVAAQVRHTLAPFVGTSLVGLDGRKLRQELEALPTVISVGYDRAFPHTLRVTVVPERPVAVLRKGPSAWLISARARLVRRVSRTARPALPRVWVPAAMQLTAGYFLPSEQGGDEARALAFTDRFPYRVESASFAAGSLVFHLRSGIELRLGDPSDIKLKLAVARRALVQLPAGTTYLDVGLPLRPVAGSESSPQVTSTQNSQVSGGG